MQAAWSEQNAFASWDGDRWHVAHLHDAVFMGVRVQLGHLSDGGGGTHDRIGMMASIGHGHIRCSGARSWDTGAGPAIFSRNVTRQCRRDADDHQAGTDQADEAI